MRQLMHFISSPIYPTTPERLTFGGGEIDGDLRIGWPAAK